MNRSFKLIGLSVAALLTVGLLGGCADQEARTMAQQALDKANAAQACCDQNSAKVDRMYQKIMSK